MQFFGAPVYLSRRRERPKKKVLGDGSLSSWSSVKHGGSLQELLPSPLTFFFDSKVVPLCRRLSSVRENLPTIRRSQNAERRTKRVRLWPPHEASKPARGDRSQWVRVSERFVCLCVSACSCCVCACVQTREVKY